MPGLYDDIITEETAAPVAAGPGLYDDIVNEQPEVAPTKLEFLPPEDLSGMSPEQLEALNFKRRSEAGLIPYTPHEAKTIFDPIVSLPRYEGRAAMQGGTTPTTEVAGGVYNTAAGVVEGFTSPAALLSLGVGAAFPGAGKVLAAAWAGKMGADVPTQIKESYEALTTPEAPLFEKIEKPLSLGANLLFTGLAARHAVKGTPVGKVLSSGLSRSLEALKETPGKGGEAVAVKEAEPVLEQKEPTLTEAPKVEGEPNAIPIRPTEEVLRDVPKQPEEGRQGLPPEESVGRFPPGRQGESTGQAGDVVLKQPWEMTPAERKAGDWVEVWRQDRKDAPRDPLTPGKHWGTKEQADAIKNRELEAGREPGQLHHAFIRVTNPLETYDGGFWEKPIAEAKAKGNDTVTYLNEGEQVGGKSYIPLSPEQIRVVPETPPKAPSPQAMGITPPGSGLLRQVIDAVKPKAQEKLPVAPSTAGEWLPDLGDRSINKEIGAEPTGIGRIPVLNWLLDPRQRIRTAPEKALMGWTYEQAIGDAHVKALGSTFGTKFKDLFPRDPETGEFTTVERTKPEQSLMPSDVFEQLQRSPDTYKLTPEQRAGFDELMKYETRARELEQKYGLRQNPETGEFEPGKSGSKAYWTRGKPIGEPQPKGPGGGAIGGKQYFQKARGFRTEQEGVSKGFRYPLNVDDRILFRLSRLYKAMADQRLANDKDLGGRWGGNPRYGEEAVFQPAFQRRYDVEGKTGKQHSVVEHKVFPADVAAKIRSKLNTEQTPWLKGIATVNDFIKSISLGLDLGVPFIQGLVIGMGDVKAKKAWATSTTNMLKTLGPGGKNVFSRYLLSNPENITAARELAQYGSSVGSIPEMIAGLDRGGPVSRVIDVAGKTIKAAGMEKIGEAVSKTKEVPEAFGRSFQNFLDTAKVERWKALREFTPPEERSRVIQAIESELQSSRMESIGLHPAQALFERLLFLAPSYYRGAVSLVGTMAQKGVSGKVAQKALGHYMVGTVATFGALAAAAGLSWDEIKRRLNPANGNFLMVPVKIAGKSHEIGFGGIFRSLMRLGGDVIETAIKSPEDFKSAKSDKNPLSRWLRGHSSPAVGTAWNLASGQDYMGKDADIVTQGRTVMPLWLKGESPAVMAASFLGLNAYPQGVRSKLLTEQDRLAKERFGKSYGDLKISQQLQVARAIGRNPEFAVREPATPQQIERAFRAQVERQDNVQKALLAPVQEVLKEKGLHVTGYEPTLRIGPTSVYLTDDQRKRYEALIIEEYNRVLKNRMKLLRTRDPVRGQELLNDWLLDAKKRAQARLRMEFNK